MVGVLFLRCRVSQGWLIVSEVEGDQAAFVLPQPPPPAPLREPGYFGMEAGRMLLEGVEGVDAALSIVIFWGLGRRIRGSPETMCP